MTGMTVEVINGARHSFGPREVVKNAPYEAGDGTIKNFIAPLLTVAGDATLLAASSTDETVEKIPAYSLILDAWLYVKTAFTATTAVSITAGSEGTTAGLVTAAGIGAKANLTAHSWQQCDGALRGASWDSSDASIVASWNVADATAAGEGALLVRFIPPLVV